MSDESSYENETYEEYEEWIKAIEAHVLKHFGPLPDFDDGTWITMEPAW